MRKLPADTPAKKWVLGIALFLLSLFLIFSLFVNRYLEPALRKRLHTIIIQGSDSLYTYQLGRLDANFFGGSVEVRNLHINIDSARYLALSKANALPALTMELDLASGQIKGIDIFEMLFNKRVVIDEIISREANVRLLRHIRNQDALQNTQPLWKAMQPAINSITINRVNLDGIKLLYKNADISEAVKLQFDRCEGLFNDIRVDSAAAADTSRIAFIKNINLKFNDLKFRTPDSTYKMKAESITYASRTRTFEVMDFKIQPTLEEKAAFYKDATRQETMYVLQYDRMKLDGFRLDHFINRNRIEADTLLLEKPEATMYMDKTLPPQVESKVGKYPHQSLLKAAADIRIKNVIIKKAAIAYTEKAQRTGKEGTVKLSALNIDLRHVTNDAQLIRQNPTLVLDANGRILESPLRLHMQFDLRDTAGNFYVQGAIKDMHAEQLNTIAEPLANVHLKSFDIQQLDFTIQGNDFKATSNVQMVYDNLFIELLKQDDETGAVKTKKLLTKLLNRFTLYESNPYGGVTRQATGSERLRISSQSFFGLVWKALFNGMQDVMLRSGRYE